MAWTLTGGDGRVILTATNRQTGETFTVRAPLADSYNAACELASNSGLTFLTSWMAQTALCGDVGAGKRAR